MFSSTRGIVIHSIRYSETSQIVKIYTEEFGMLSFLMKGARRPKSSTRMALLIPMTLVQVMVNFREQKNIQSCREISLCSPYLNIPFDFRKESLMMFINELLYRSIREEEKNQPLFSFIWNGLQLLDHAEEPFSSFHLLFMSELMSYLGIKPQAYSGNEPTLFNVQEGTFSINIPLSNETDDHETARLFGRLMGISLEDYSTFCPPAYLRNRLLNLLIQYYEIHLPGFHGMKSHLVLHTVFS